MDPHKRFFGYCANQRRVAPAKYEVIADTGRLLRTLILFDHVTIHSIRLREFHGFATDLGLEGVIELLRSKALRIFPDTVAFGGPVQVGEHARTENTISITKIGQPRGFSLAKDLAWLRESLAVSPLEFETLEGAIRAALAPMIASYGQDAEEDTYRDLAANPEALKVAVAAQLRWRHGFAIRPRDFRLRMSPLRRGVYHADTDLPGLCRLPTPEIDDEITTALAGLAHLNLRIEEMRGHSSITAFDDQDLTMFENRIAFLLDRQNARDQEAAFRRVVSLLDFPEIPVGHFDAEKFLRLREQSECLEFRNWLSASADWSDGEIKDQVGSLRNSIGRFYQNIKGKALRVVGSIGLGIVAPPLVGAAFTVADAFLLDKVLKPAGAITFIASEYPSLFTQSE